MINRFSSVGYIDESSPFCLLAKLRARFLLFLLLSLTSCFEPDPFIAPVTVQQRRSGLLSLCPLFGTSFVFFTFFLLLFFSAFPRWPPPLGKSSASSNMSLDDGGVSLDVGTGLLGFHCFTLPGLCCCLILLNLFVFGAVSLKSLSLKKMWLPLGLRL